MKIQSVEKPHSSFLSVRKDLSLLVDKMLKNVRLKRLVYYDVPDAIDQPDLTPEQTSSLINNRIKIVPKLTIDGSVRSYVIIGFDNFIPNGENPEFKDNTVSFDIICHFDQWKLVDSDLRPYRIAGEIDSMFNGKHLTGIGKLEFMGCSQIILNDEFGGLSLIYRAVHGIEDQKKMPNPNDEEKFVEDFIKSFG